MLYVTKSNIRKVEYSVIRSFWLGEFVDETGNMKIFFSSKLLIKTGDNNTNLMSKIGLSRLFKKAKELILIH